MSESLLSELSQFVNELEHKERAVVYTVPDEVMKTVKRTKSLETLLHEIFMQVSGNRGIQFGPILRREFGMNTELMDRFKQWAPYSKDHFENELHDAIDRAEIRAGNQGVFFKGTPGHKEAQEALQLVKDIAHAAIKCQFMDGVPVPDPYVSILDKLLQFYALPNTYPEGNVVNYRNLISEDRLYAMSGDDSVTDALKSFARDWYQQSSHTFLESREGYFSYEHVRFFLYALTEEQLGRLKSSYFQHIEDEFRIVKAERNLHRARKLKSMLETVVNWTLQGTRV
jgi:hypothetical protein